MSEQEALQEFKNQGLDDDKAAEATQAAITIAKLSGATLEQATDDLISTVNSFSVTNL